MRNLAQPDANRTRGARARRYAEPRFNSSLRMMDSAISFIERRVCWLSRCIAR
jgi:hypothetical protein